MKKQVLISILLTAILAISGCTGNRQEDTNAGPEAGTVIESTVPAQPQESVVVESPEIEEASAVDTEEDPVTAGRPEGDTYTSDSMAFKFTIADDWTFLSRSQIAKEMGWSEQYASDTLLKITGAGYPYIDMWAQNSDGSIRVQVLWENTQVNFGAHLTAEEYIAYCATSIPDSYRSKGVEVIDEPQYAKELLGIDFEVFSFTASFGANTMYQTMLSTEKGGYIFSIYVTCLNEDAAEDALWMFSPA